MTMFIDTAACNSFWRSYLAQLPPAHPHHAAKPDSFGFGGVPDLAEELAMLVLAGIKRATTSLPVEYTSLDEALPRVGDLSIVVRGDGSPAAIIERTRIESCAFDRVDRRFASVEGEGDGSLAYWRQVHIEYFSAVCGRFGHTFNGSTLVLCQEFRVVWPTPSAPPRA